jgi:hypothetical protein
MSDMPDMSDAEAIRDLLRSSDPAVREQALELLRSLPTPRTVAMVSDLFPRRRFRHRIVLNPDSATDTPWLGLTLRTARTFVRIRDGQPCLSDGGCLTLADEAERRALFGLRGRENREVGFRWPRLSTTISAGDLLSVGAETGS